MTDSASTMMYQERSVLTQDTNIIAKYAAMMYATVRGRSLKEVVRRALLGAPTMWLLEMAAMVVVEI